MKTIKGLVLSISLILLTGSCIVESYVPCVNHCDTLVPDCCYNGECEITSKECKIGKDKRWDCIEVCR